MRAQRTLRGQTSSPIKQALMGSWLWDGDPGKWGCKRETVDRDSQTAQNRMVYVPNLGTHFTDANFSHHNTSH